MQQQLSPVNKTGNKDDILYNQYLMRIANRFDALTASGVPVFETDANDRANPAAPRLFDTAYLDTFADPEQRQYHNCNYCRHFINYFGTLAVLDELGNVRSAIWFLDDNPGPYAEFVTRMIKAVEASKITGVFKTSEKFLGEPTIAWSDRWTHFHVNVNAAYIHTDKLQTAFQAAAEKREDYKTMEEALRRYFPAVVERALALLESETMYRAEKVIGPARFLHEIHVAMKGEHNPRTRANILWRAVATASAGFCHPRSSMIGSMLDDLTDGMNIDMVKRRFSDKMDPLKYQRPQAAPSAGNLAQAEKVIEILGVARSLERRFARVEELTSLWKPVAQKPAAPAGIGVFSHIKAKNAPVSRGVDPATTVGGSLTFSKFRESILVKADKVEIYVGTGRQNFVGVLTAVHADAPPILQWDTNTIRNPLSWYVIHNGSYPHQWSVEPNTWQEVTAVSLNPSMWGEPTTNHSQSAIFSFAGCVTAVQSGNALFPECLRSELREVRATIEAYSKTAVIAGTDEASANGILLPGGGDMNVKVRVTSRGLTTIYTIDRWN